MKKIIFCFSLCFSVFAYGQNTSIGIKFGPNFSSIQESGLDEKLGFRIGALITHSISKEFGVGAEVNFARKGAGRDQAAINLDYLEIPVFAQYFLTTSGPTRPKLIFGGYYGLLLNASRNGNDLSIYEDGDYGLLVGIGFHQRLGKKRWLYLDLRYTFGLAEIVEATNTSNRDLSLNAGISFPLGNF